MSNDQGGERALPLVVSFNHRDEILIAIIDRAIGTELHAGLAFFLRAGRDEHGCTESLGELDRRRADAR